LAAAARISRPGQRLFVGPGNLRKTPYSDAYLYYELGDLVPVEVERWARYGVSW
jgi:hypothetical protein